MTQISTVSKGNMLL